MALSTPLALAAYEPLANHYDVLTAGYDYEPWLAKLERLAVSCGLVGRNLLDVACGTGRSFEPLARRGYAVTACDISPEMVARARERGNSAELFVCDMRALPAIGPYDLVTCLDDSINYLLEEADLDAAMRSFARVLAPDGLVVFDVNTRGTYRRVFGGTRVVADEGTYLVWRGHGVDGTELQLTASATVDIFATNGAGWTRSRSDHRQRYWTDEGLRAAAESAGLEIAAVRGQRTGAVLCELCDDERDAKRIFVLRLGR